MAEDCFRDTSHSSLFHGFEFKQSGLLGNSTHSENHQNQELQPMDLEKDEHLTLFTRQGSLVFEQETLCSALCIVGPLSICVDNSNLLFFIHHLPSQPSDLICSHDAPPASKSDHE